jgi:hypothetical protein
MKKQVIILIALLLSSQFLLSQMDASKKMEQFIEKKATDWQESYEKKDVVAYAKLLKEFAGIYESLDSISKQDYLGTNSSAHYTMACLYAIANNKKEALDFLYKTIAAGSGYFDYKTLDTDPDIDNIRNEPEFQKILAKMKQCGDYLSILKNANKYSISDNRSIPKFSYQGSDNPNLVALREGFNLDSIAGQGSDVLKILNLMHWIHDVVPHDGMNGNPEVKNAMSMLEVCKKENRGLNCRGLALVLNECYLAMGIKSRVVTCLPKDSLKIDQDCHVINSVYSESLKKWLWIDPTFDAYVMSETGEMLSIEEVRERLINDNALILNPDANWNNQSAQTKEDYLEYYMAKNLYILECASSSEYNMETRTDGKTMSYIRLLPLDYFEQTPDKVEEKGEKSNTLWITYKTNNPNLFWER